VIGGLVTSTLLSLLVIPAAFTYLDDAKNWISRLGQRGAASADGVSGTIDRSMTEL
jgi:hypothetical protein